MKSKKKNGEIDRYKQELEFYMREKITDHQDKEELKRTINYLEMDVNKLEKEIIRLNDRIDYLKKTKNK